MYRKKEEKKALNLNAIEMGSFELWFSQVDETEFLIQEKKVSRFNSGLIAFYL